MRAELSDEQLRLLAMARSMARDLGATSTADLLAPESASEGWRAVRETGLLGVHLPVAAGGGGGGALELALVVQAFGEGLCSTPLMSAAAALKAMHQARMSGEVQEALTGGIRPVIAVDHDWGRLGDALCPDAAGADRAVVWTRAADGIGLAMAELAPRPGRYGDRSRVVGVPGSPMAQPVLGPWDLVAALVLVLAAADLVGVGRAALDDAVGHCRERRQFGVAVGSFQAVKHLAADAHTGLVAAECLMRAAAWSLDHRPVVEALAVARQAKAVASEAGQRACETACQMLGGIGHTWEQLASVRLRRVVADRVLLGDEQKQYAALAGRASLPPPEGEAEEDAYDLRDTAAEAAFRTELRGWLAEHRHEAEAVAAAGDPESALTATLAWQRELGRGRWIGVSFPADGGGRGLPVTYEAIVNDEIGLAGCPPVPSVSHLTAAIDRFGTAEQRAEHLAPMLSAGHRWCQGFSEPGAGSDLAAIATRAELVDGQWVISGRKIWTSEAAWAAWCLLLCRTEPDKARHRGLSVLLVPMDAPGIGIDPIVTAWGTGEFAEVAFDEVQVPADAILGSRGQGWEIAMSLLEVERGPADMGWISRLRRTLSALEVDSAGAEKGAETARAAAWLAALQQTVARTLTRRLEGQDHPGEGSVDKLLLTDVDQLIHSLYLDVSGGPALAEDGHAVERYLWSRAASIFGGTSQIQRNIIAERLLNLPRGGG